MSKLTWLVHKFDRSAALGEDLQTSKRKSPAWRPGSSFRIKSYSFQPSLRSP